MEINKNTDQGGLKESDPGDLKMSKIEKKVWHLILLAVVVILYLTLSILAVFIMGFTEDPESPAFSPAAYRYTIFLSALVLLFCGYMISQQRRLIQLTRAFETERQTSQFLERNIEILTSLLTVSTSINSKSRLSDVLDTITKEILSAFHADHSSIMLVDRKSQMLRCRSSSGEGAEKTRDALVPVGRGIAGRVFQEGQPLLLNGDADERKFPGMVKKTRHIHSSLCIPLRLERESIGVLNINRLKKGNAFRETDLQLLSVFANNAAIAIQNAVLRREKHQRVRLQTMFEQMHSPRVAEELIRKSEGGRKSLKMREKKEVTVLFADIRGFSRMVNFVDVEVIMDFLDDFYNIMTKAVFDNEGNVDKFIGDEVMAFFGAPNTLENASENGLNTAMEMVTYFEWIRDKHAKKTPDIKGLGIGVGINTGEAFVGNVGSGKRYEYTVIGNSVNLARRLCSYAEPGQIIISEDLQRRIPDDICSEIVRQVSFKGFPEPLNVYKMTHMT